MSSSNLTHAQSKAPGTQSPCPASSGGYDPLLAGDNAFRPPASSTCDGSVIVVEEQPPLAAAAASDSPRCTTNNNSMHNSMSSLPGSLNGGCHRPSIPNGCGGAAIPEAPTVGWMPTGGYSGLNDLSVETISVVGLAGQGYWLSELLDRYLKAPKEMRTPEVASAFVTGAAHQARRAVIIVRPMLKRLADQEELDQDGREKMAALLAEVCCLESVQILFARCQGSKMSLLFYHALIKAVTEGAKYPDLNLAMRVATELVAQGHKHTCCSTRMIMVGFTRNPQDTIGMQTALNVMDWRLAISSNNIETCFAHHFFSVLEAATGAQVPIVTKYLKEVLEVKVPNLQAKLVSAATEAKDPNDCECECPEKGTVYSLVDPYTLTLPTTNNATECITNYRLPPRTAAMFLYSAVRDMCAKANSLAEDHPLSIKLMHIKNLIRFNPKQCWVFTLREELELRPPTAGAAVTHHCRMICFSIGVSQCAFPGCDFSVVTGDPCLEAAIRHRVPEAHVVKQLPLLP